MALKEFLDRAAGRAAAVSKDERHRCSPAFGIASNFLTTYFAGVTGKLLMHRVSFSVSL